MTTPRKVNTERGSIGLIVLGLIVLLAGIAAFALVNMDMVNSAEVGTAKTVGGAGCGVGALMLLGGITLRKNKS